MGFQLCFVHESIIKLSDTWEIELEYNVDPQYAGHVIKKQLNYGVL